MSEGEYAAEDALFAVAHLGDSSQTVYTEHEIIMAMEQAASNKRDPIVTFGAKDDYLAGILIEVTTLGGGSTKCLKVQTRDGDGKPETVVIVDAEIVRGVEKQKIPAKQPLLFECTGIDARGWPEINMLKGNADDLKAALAERGGAYRKVTPNAEAEALRKAGKNTAKPAAGASPAVPAAGADDDIPF